MPLPGVLSYVSGKDISYWLRLIAAEGPFARTIFKVYYNLNNTIVFDYDGIAYTVQHNTPPLWMDVDVFQMNEFLYLPHLSHKLIKSIIKITSDSFYFINLSDEVYIVTNIHLPPEKVVFDSPTSIKVIEVKSTEIWSLALSDQGEVYYWTRGELFGRKVEQFPFIVSIDASYNVIAGLDRDGFLNFYLIGADRKFVMEKVKNVNITSLVKFNEFVFVRVENGEVFYIHGGPNDIQFVKVIFDGFLPDIYQIGNSCMIAWSEEENIFYVYSLGLRTFIPMPKETSFTSLLQCIGLENWIPTLIYIQANSYIAPNNANFVFTPNAFDVPLLSPFNVCYDTTWSLLNLLPKELQSSIEMFKHYSEVVFVITKDEQVYAASRMLNLVFQVNHFRSLSDRKIVDICMETSTLRMYALGRNGKVYSYLISTNNQQQPLTVAPYNPNRSIEDYAVMKKFRFYNIQDENFTRVKIVSIKSGTWYTVALSENCVVFILNGSLFPQIILLSQMAIVEIALCHNNLICLSSDRKIIYNWDPFSPVKSATYDLRINSITCLLNFYCFTSDQGRLHVCDNHTNATWHWFDGGYKEVFSPDGRIIIARMNDGLIRAMRPEEGFWYWNQTWHTVADVVFQFQKKLIITEMTKMVLNHEQIIQQPDYTFVQVITNEITTLLVDQNALMMRSSFFQIFFDERWGDRNTIRELSSSSTIATITNYIEYLVTDRFEFASWRELLDQIEWADYIDDQRFSSRLIKELKLRLCRENALSLLILLVDADLPFRFIIPSRVVYAVGKLVLFNIDYIRQTPAFFQMTNILARNFLWHFSNRHMDGDLKAQVKIFKAFYSNQIQISLEQ